MSFFKKIFKKKVGGYIKAHKLEQWWEDNFNGEERKYIISKYQPMGASENILVEGSRDTNRVSKAYFLANLASWFNTKKDLEIARKMILESEKRLHKMSISDEHFYYLQLIKFYYLDRENEESFNSAIKACECQINISKEARKYFLKKYGHPLPAHTGFKQLAIIEEKRKNYNRAIELSKRAKLEGWTDDWDKRIKRLEKKLEK